MVILVTDSSWKNFQRSIQGLEKRSSYVWWDFEKTTLAAGREWVIKADQKLDELPGTHHHDPASHTVTFTLLLSIFLYCKWKTIITTLPFHWDLK